MAPTPDTESFVVVLVEIQPREGAAQRIHETFGLKASTAQRLVDKMPRAIKKGVSKAKAKAYARKMAQIGGTIEIRRLQAPSSDDAAPKKAAPPKAAPPTPADEVTAHAPEPPAVDASANPTEAQASAATETTPEAPPAPEPPGDAGDDASTDKPDERAAQDAQRAIANGEDAPETPTPAAADDAPESAPIIAHAPQDAAAQDAAKAPEPLQTAQETIAETTTPAAETADDDTASTEIGEPAPPEDVEPNTTHAEPPDADDASSQVEPADSAATAPEPQPSAEDTAKDEHTGQDTPAQASEVARDGDPAAEAEADDDEHAPTPDAEPQRELSASGGMPQLPQTTEGGQPLLSKSTPSELRTSSGNLDALHISGSAFAFDLSSASAEPLPPQGEAPTGAAEAQSAKEDMGGLDEDAAVQDDVAPPPVADADPADDLAPADGPSSVDEALDINDLLASPDINLDADPQPPPPSDASTALDGFESLAADLNPDALALEGVAPLSLDSDGPSRRLLPSDVTSSDEALLLESTPALETPSANAEDKPLAKANVTGVASVASVPRRNIRGKRSRRAQLKASSSVMTLGEDNAAKTASQQNASRPVDLFAGMKRVTTSPSRNTSSSQGNTSGAPWMDSNSGLHTRPGASPSFEHDPAAQPSPDRPPGAGANSGGFSSLNQERGGEDGIESHLYFETNTEQSPTDFSDQHSGLASSSRLASSSSVITSRPTSRNTSSQPRSAPPSPRNTGSYSQIPAKPRRSPDSGSDIEAHEPQHHNPDVDFDDIIKQAYIAPLKGTGVIWVAMPTVALTMGWCMAGCAPQIWSVAAIVWGIAFWGLAQNYFDQMFAIGQTGEIDGPPLQELIELQERIPLTFRRGLLTMVMTIGLAAPMLGYGYYTGVNEIMDPNADSISAERPIEDDETFYDKRGGIVQWKLSLDPTIAYTQPGDESTKVRIDPIKKTVITTTVVNEFNDKSDWLVKCWRKAKKKLNWSTPLIMLLLLGPLFLYTPMAVAVASTCKRPGAVFDFPDVFKAMWRAGGKYIRILSILLMAVTFTALVSAVTLEMGASLMLIMLAAALPSYLTGVVGYIMGHIDVAHPSALPKASRFSK